MSGTLDDLRRFAVAHLNEHGSSTVGRMAEQLSADEFGICRANRLRYALATLEREQTVERVGKTHATGIGGVRRGGPRPWLWALTAHGPHTDRPHAA